MSKKKITFDKLINLKLLKRKKGSSEVELKIKNEHLNYGGILHGGVITSICDCVLADAVTCHLDKDEWCVTIQLNVDFIEPGFLGETIYGFGKLIRKGKTLAFVEGEVRGKNKKIIAKAHGVWFIKRGPSAKLHLSKSTTKMD